ncbi:MAG: radical SAM protein [Caldimicrobium sp.]
MGLIFGPVKSRRLGLSLGLELVPKKICSMDCLYCEVGKTSLLTNERKAYYSWEEIEASLRDAKKRESDFDVLTLTGSGEPTLNIYFEKTVEEAKKILHKPISVLTNSSTVMMPSVREALSKVHLVLASLDAALEESFYFLNRPAKGVNLGDIIEGLKTLRENMEGELWLEVLLVKGINNKLEDLRALKEAIDYIKPHKIQLNTVVRPPAYLLAKPLSYTELENIKSFLGERVEVICPQNLDRAKSFYQETIKKLSVDEIELLILDYLKRRPATFSELLVFFNDEGSLQRLLEKMINDGKIKRITHQGEIFYSA